MNAQRQHDDDKRWKPRPPRRDGSSMFIKTFDGLALALFSARFANAATLACLLMIHTLQQRDYKKGPQAITVRQFSEATGYVKSRIQAALKELQERKAIAVAPGTGGHSSRYSVAHHSHWTEAPARTRQQVQARTRQQVQAGPELVPVAKIKSPHPLNNPLREKNLEKKKRRNGFTATTAVRGHQVTDENREEATGLRGTPAPNNSTNGSVEGRVGLEALR